jgi:hypothetical protein
MAFDDLRPLLVLADSLGAPAAEVSGHWGNAATPGGLRLRRVLLDWLVGKGRWGEAGTLATVMLARPPQTGIARHDLAEAAEDHRRLTAFIDLQIEAGRAAEARPLWNALAPAEGSSVEVLVNPDFTGEPANHGFDWRVHPGPGVRFHWRPHQVEFVLSGEQESEALLLVQPIALAGRQRRRYHFSASLALSNRSSTQSEGLAHALHAGFAWSIHRQGLADIPLEIEADTQGGYFSVPAPGSGEIPAELRLTYRRPYGTAKLQGRLSISHVALVPINHSSNKSDSEELYR